MIIKMRHVSMIMAMIFFIMGMIYLSFLSSMAAETETSMETVIVRGDSLAPFMLAGQEVEICRGYYRSHPVERDDVVLVDYAGNENYLIKIVKGVAGDRLALQEADAGKGWNILINDKVLTNSEGRDYVVTGKRRKMISLYAGVISENVYLVLGNVPSGSLDSTRFGLIDKIQIIARVEK